MASYNYSLSGDFLNGLNPSQFRTEVNASPGITPNCIRIDTSGNVVLVVFDGTLSGAEIIELDALVAAHVATNESTTDIISIGTIGTTTTLRGNQTTNRILDLPDANDTIVARNTIDTLTGKTISGASNTITDIAASVITSGNISVNRGGTGGNIFTPGSWLQGNGTGAIIAVKNNLTAIIAPTSTNDSADGYLVGSRWIDTVTIKEYVCMDNTATAAIWVETTGGGGGGTVSVSGGGTGLTSLLTNRVVVSDATLDTNPVNISKVAPSGVFVGTTDVQTLTNKTIIDPSNDVYAKQLFTGSGAGSVNVFDATAPTVGQVLTATSGTIANWQTPLAGTFTVSSATNTITTTSLTYVAMANMTVTIPTTGRYLIMWTGVFSYNTLGARIDTGLHHNNVLIASTNIFIGVGGSGNDFYNNPITGYYVANINAGDPLNLRWFVSAGTATCVNRIFSATLLNINL